MEYFATFIYASCNVDFTRELYEELIRAGRLIDKPWLLGGDFNAILSPMEKKGGTLGSLISMTDFQNFVAGVGLMDAGFVGNPFTWSNNQVGKKNIKARLDRVLLSDSWLERAPAIVIKHLMREPSDHSPLLIYQSQVATGPSRFVFQHMWLENENFKTIIRDAWYAASSSHHNPFYSLQFKLKAIKPVIKHWNKSEFGNIFENKLRAEEEVKQAETAFDADPSDENRETLQYF